MKISIKNIVIYCILVLIFSSCHKIEQLPVIPRIEFTSFSVFDTTDILGNLSKGGCLKFYFEDGDGNIGLEEPTSEETDTTNLFITLYEKIDDEFIMVTDPANPLKPADYRIPYMENTGQNKIMTGTISLRFIYLYYDTDDSTKIQYSFKIKDRDDQYSNLETTCEIPLSVNGNYTKGASEANTYQ
jgi:hypothetical protein